jgi:hypothetical protein
MIITTALTFAYRREQIHYPGGGIFGVKLQFKF